MEQITIRNVSGIELKIIYFLRGEEGDQLVLEPDEIFKFEIGEKYRWIAVINISGLSEDLKEHPLLEIVEGVEGTWSWQEESSVVGFLDF